MAKTVGLTFDEKAKAPAQTPAEKPFKQLGAEKQIEYVKSKDWTNNIQELKDLLDFAKPTAKPIIEKGIKFLEDEAKLAELKEKVAAIEGLEVEENDTIESLEEKLKGVESGD